MAAINSVVDQDYAKNKTFLLILILLCFPFIQLGITFYLSVQILAFILVVFIIPIKIFVSFVPLGFTLISLMCLPSIFSVNSTYLEHDILKTGREFLCYAPIYCIIKYNKIFLQGIKINPSIKKVVPIILLFLLIMTVSQTIFLRQGIYLSIPYEFFATNYQTLPNALDLKYSHIRPAATFGEPSYLGFILSTLLIVVLRIYEKSWLKYAMILSIVVTVYLCMSAAGQFSVFALLFIYFMQSKIKAITKFSLITMACLIVIIAWAANLSSFSTVERFSNIFDKKKESSGYFRLAQPAIIVYEVLLNSPIGVTNSELGKFIVSNGNMSKNDLYGALSNGLYNMLINYGVTGGLLLVLLLLALWKDWLIVAYIFLATFFNGAFLAFDKSAVIVASLYMVFYFTAEIKHRLISKNV